MATDPAFGCYYTASDADTMIDRGTFLSMDGEGRLLAREVFALIRTAGGSYRAVANHEAADGTYAFEAAWDYDALFNPRGAQARYRQGERTWSAEIAPAESGAMLCWEEAGSRTTRRLDYRHGWMIDLDPSAVPLSVMMRRYDRLARGEQSFRWVGYAGPKNHTFLDNVLVKLTHRGTIEVPGEGAAEGARLLEAFEAEETLVGLEGPGITTRAQMRLWTDLDGALLRFVFTAARGTVVQWREGEEALAAHLG